MPKRPSRISVSDMLAQGLASRKLTTAGIEAPLRYSSIESARHPWLQLEARNHSRVARAMTRFLAPERYVTMYAFGTKWSTIPPMMSPSTNGTPTLARYPR